MHLSEKAISGGLIKAEYGRLIVVAGIKAGWIQHTVPVTRCQIFLRRTD